MQRLATPVPHPHPHLSSYFVSTNFMQRMSGAGRYRPFDGLAG